MVEIYLGGHLNFYQPDKRTRFSFAVAKNITLAALLQQIGIPVAEVAFATVNGNLVELPEAQVFPEDLVELYPPMGGG